MKYLSASAAAKVAHKSKIDILNSIKNGGMSASKNKRGHWEIDPSELNRVFPYTVPEPTQSHMNELKNTDIKTSEISALQVEVKMLREQLKFRDEILTELRHERDDWKAQAKTLLVTDQKRQTGFFSIFRKQL
jgi:hypothetical protein